MVGGRVLDHRHRDLDADGDQRARRGVPDRPLVRGAGDRLRPGAHPRLLHPAPALLPRRVRERLRVPRRALRAQRARARLAGVPDHAAAGRGRAAVRLRDPDQAAARRAGRRRQLLHDHRRADGDHARLHVRRRHQGRDLDRRDPDEPVRGRRAALRDHPARAHRARRPRHRRGGRPPAAVRLPLLDPHEPLRGRDGDRRRRDLRDGLARLGPADRAARARLPQPARRPEGDDRQRPRRARAVPAVLARRRAAVGLLRPEDRRAARAADLRPAVPDVHPRRAARRASPAC